MPLISRRSAKGCFGHLTLLALAISAGACGPVPVPTSPQASSFPRMSTPSSQPPTSDLTLQEPPPTSSAYQVLAVVREGEVILRAGPGTDFPVVAHLRLGEAAPVVGRTQLSDWLMLDLGGTTAWVYGAFVKIVGDPVGVPIPPTPTLPPP